jgi:hypothetical protein
VTITVTDTGDCSPTLTGKNASSYSYALAFDYVEVSR